MKCKHNNKRSVNGVMGGDGKPVYGGPPASDEEPAWCRDCGALRTQSLFGWTWSHPISNKKAPTVLNMLRNKLTAHLHQRGDPRDDAVAEDFKEKFGEVVPEVLSDIPVNADNIAAVVAAHQSEVRTGTIPNMAHTLAQTAQSLLNNKRIEGLVLLVVAEGSLTGEGPLEIVFIRKGFPEAAGTLTKALERMPGDLALAEKVAAGGETH